MPALTLAHPLSPGLLELDVRSTDVDVIWETPAVLAWTTVTPRFEPSCSDTSKRHAEIREGRLRTAWTIRCSPAPQSLTIDGLADLGTNVLLRARFEGDERPTTVLLSRASPRWSVAPSDANATTIGAFFVAGFWHTAGGLDHILFLGCLIFLLVGWRKRLVAVTAFSLGHAAAIGVTALDLIAPPGRVIELGIAASLVLSAVWLARRRETNVAPITAAAFGLLHGLDFAASLAPVASESIVPMLIGFNLGVEVAHLIIMAGFVALSVVLAKRPRVDALASRAFAYGVGTVAVFWMWERSGLWG